MDLDMAVTFLMDFTNLIRLIEIYFLLISRPMGLRRFRLEVLIRVWFLEGLIVYGFWLWILDRAGRFKFLGFKLDALGNLKMEVIVRSVLIARKVFLILLIRLFFCRKGKACWCLISFCMGLITINSLVC